jgi:hypothetical protein
MRSVPGTVLVTGGAGFIGLNLIETLLNVGVRVLSFDCAFVIIFINTLLKNVVVYLTVFERHETRTAYNLSVAMKLVIARFVNTAIVPVVVNIYSNRWFVDGGLVSDIFSIMVSIAFVDPLVQMMNIGGNI